MSKNLALIGLLLLSVAASPAAWALRCGRQLVEPGDALVTVRMRCGEPLYKDRRVEYRVIRLHNPGIDLERYVPVEVDEWTYDFGPNRFMRVLLFENGRLVDIQSLDYGRD